ncbi:phage virion morphogenesis protein [Candidatus Methylocalor cossyra]|uniref:Prophage MuMc02, virion morphogenesis protein n=1 Tax=Candidatus Methylocalor cossyra TaxID=3108543 RepID=A0ABM9NKZ7_9GAMM
MTDLIEIRIDSRALEAALDQLARATANLTPLMRSLGAELVDLTEGRFEAEGPGWPDLAEATKQRRAKSGHWPGKMLQVSGQLAASITTEVGPSSVLVGSAKKYAAIHQLGGQAGRGHTVIIPPRPYLPVNEDGSLFPDAESAMVDVVLDYLHDAMA